MPAIWYLLAIVGAAVVGGLLWGVTRRRAPAVLLGSPSPRRPTPSGSRGPTSSRPRRLHRRAVVVCLLLDRLQRASRQAPTLRATRPRRWPGWTRSSPTPRWGSPSSTSTSASSGSTRRWRPSPGTRSTTTSAGPSTRWWADRDLGAVRPPGPDSGRPALTVPVAIQQPGGARTDPAGGELLPACPAPRAVDGVGVIVRDVTAQTEAEADREPLFDRVAPGRAVTAGLAAASSTAEVSDVILVQGAGRRAPSRGAGRHRPGVRRRSRSSAPGDSPRTAPPAWFRGPASSRAPVTPPPPGGPHRRPDAAARRRQHRRPLPHMARHFVALGVESVGGAAPGGGRGRVGSMGLGFAGTTSSTAPSTPSSARSPASAPPPSNGPGSTTPSSGPGWGPRRPTSGFAFLADATRRLTVTLD